MDCELFTDRYCAGIIAGVESFFTQAQTALSCVYRIPFAVLFVGVYTEAQYTVHTGKIQGPCQFSPFFNSLYGCNLVYIFLDRFNT
ncbi:hypothetical protein D3C86_1294550 [compost metagenome]